MDTQTAAVEEMKPIVNKDRLIPYERGEMLATVEIDCRPLVYPTHDGFLLNAGINRIRIRRKHIAALNALVETEPLEIAAAARRLEVERQRWIEEYAPGGEPELVERAKDEFPMSLESIFQRDNRRSIMPFNYVRVIEDGIAAPIDEEQRDQQTLLAEQIAIAVARALDGRAAAAPIMSDKSIEAMISAAVDKRVAAELEKLTGGAAQSAAPAKAEASKKG